MSRSSDGFTLLLAVLISSVLLTLGLAIFSITIRQLLLSTTARDSQFAFYAADAGAECALYWDLQHSAFSTTTSSNINCNYDGSNTSNQNMPVGGNSQVGGSGWDKPSTFALTFFPDSYCAVVSVTKHNAGTQASPIIQTTIDSRGYNFGTKSSTTCSSADPRRLERAVRVIY